MTSNAEAVLQFTRESGTECPDSPKPMSKDTATFIIRMIMSELDELACTVTETPEERDQLLCDAFNTRDKCKKTGPVTEDNAHLIAEQFDALVDSWYYSLDCAARHGVNMTRMFDIVHAANMAKKDPETGKFLKRDDGKIIKPEGWQLPDIALAAEISRQMSEGSWVQTKDNV